MTDSCIGQDELVDVGSTVTGELYRAKALWFEDVGEYLFSEIE